jgi:hypothetical protein
MRRARTYSKYLWYSAFAADAGGDLTMLEFAAAPAN